MTTTFKTPKVGDRVWSPVRGWGTIQAIVDSENLIIVYYGYIDITDYKEFITYSPLRDTSIPYEAIPLNTIILADSM